LAHIQNTNSQYNLPEIGKKLAYKANREGVEDHFPDPSVRKIIEVDISLINHYDKLLGAVELYITRSAKTEDVQTFSRSDFRLRGKARQMGVGAREFLRFAKLSGCDRSRV
jgi:hypothetical protein